MHNIIILCSLFVSVSNHAINCCLDFSPIVPFPASGVMFFQVKSNRRGEKKLNESKRSFKFYVMFPAGQNFPNLFPLQHFHRQEYYGSYARLPGIGNFSNFFFTKIVKILEGWYVFLIFDEHYFLYILKWELYRMTTQSFSQNISRYFLNKIKSLNKYYD